MREHGGWGRPGVVTNAANAGRTPPVAFGDTLPASGEG